MTNPVESFVISLARASKRGSWHLRGLRGADRDDVLATAMMWCWENRAKYDPHYPLEQWFDLALHDAKSKWWRRKKRDSEIISAEEFNEAMAEVLPDPTAEAAEVADAARAVFDSLTPEERTELQIRADQGGKLSSSLARKMTRLKRLLPNTQERRRVWRSLSSESDCDSTDTGPLDEHKIPYEQPESRIDREIGALSAPPKHGRDCTPCFRCMWYEHFLPKSYAQIRTVSDEEVQAAIWATEAQKLTIAQGLRDHTLIFTGVNAR